MTITGHKRRSIADQTGIVDFRFSLAFANTTGECVVGLSGTQDFRFSFKSGKIYDTIGNFVQSYEAEIPFDISGQLGQTSYDYAINNELIAQGNPIGTGKYSWLYVAPRGVAVEFDGFVRGAIPNYYTDDAGKYYYENYVVSGRVINLNPTTAFRIFDVEVLQPSSPYSVASFTTGNITGTGYINLTSDQIGLSDYVVPLLLRTNFGDVPLNFTVTGDYSVVPDVYMNVSPDTTNVVNGVAKDYLVQFAYFPTGTYLGIELEYVSGTTGNIYFFKDQVSDLQYRLLSGVVVGCARLSAQGTGLVSGQDPKTLIYEQGTGTGDFSSDILCATGDVEQDYVLKVFGLGNGFLETNYLASGEGSGLFSGIVPIQGGYLTIVGHNFTGTGDNPGVAVGFVPTGTGRYFARPTGCLTISQNLVYGDDFYSGSLSVEKVFEGALSLPYSTISVGWATGDFVSGKVDSMYVLNFEQGSYTYTKYYSGLVSGHMTNTGNFEPTGCLAEDLPVTGVLTGYFSISALLDCSATTGLPFIPITGYPLFVYDSQNRVVQPNRVVLISPSGGFGTDETSYNALAGGYTRTKTSRMGATPSGDGYFENPVGPCLDPSITSRIWKEEIPFTTDSGTFDSEGNSIGFVSTRAYLTGSGDLDADLANAQDSGVIHFFISGAGRKAVAFRGLNFGATDRILHMTLLKDGIYHDSWEEFSVQPGNFKYVEEASNGATDFDTIGISELESGYYSLYITAKEASYPRVYFSQEVFSGCESSQNIVVSVTAQGIFRNDLCVNLDSYEELTAHSGVNYDPIYLRYDDMALVDGGCQDGPARSRTCPGICFSAGTTNDSGRWEEETRTYSFTIPIHDNASFGYDHEFIVSLSDVSGGILDYPAAATVRITENDNPVFLVMTGEFMDETGILSGLNPLCEVNEPEDPEPPDPCIFYPHVCDPCLLNPYLCDSGNDYNCEGEPACCECSSVTTLVGTCPGYGSRLFTGAVPTPGTFCGFVGMEGCGPTDGYIFVGETCCSGSSLVTYTRGDCVTFDFKAYPANCVVSSDCDFADDIDWSGCEGGVCTGNCDESGNCEQTGSFNGCHDYAQRTRKKRRPKGPDCSSLFLFLKVSNVPGHACAASSSGPSCHEWGWTGACPAPAGASMAMICPPPP